MSLPPKCEVCGTRHHSHQAHDFGPPARLEKSDEQHISEEVQCAGSSASGSSDVSEERLAVHTGAESEETGVTGEGSPLTQVERNRRWRKKNRERYNETQRELMRTRRK